MYMMPDNENNLFDDFAKHFEKFWNDGLSSPSNIKTMKTDVVETSDGVELTIDLPGYEKDEVNIELDKGYLNISASKNEESEEKDKTGNYIRRERHFGKCSRSFYVGENLSQEDIKASFKNGVLTIKFPKNKKLEQSNKILIEG